MNSLKVSGCRARQKISFWLIRDVFDNLQKVLSFLTRLVKEVEMLDYEFYKRLRTVKSALNSNDEVILRTIYDDLSCRLRSRRVPDFN